MIPTLQVIASPGMGGAETAFQRVAQALSDAGHPVTCLLRDGARLDGVLPATLPRLQLPMRNYVDLPTMLRLRGLLKRGDWPVVQTWMSRATWMTRAPKNVLHVARLGGYYRPRYFRHADAWVVNTKGLYDWMQQQGFPRQRLEWINNFVPALPADTPSPLSRAALGVPDEALLVVGLGRLIEKKGFQDLIAAFAMLPQDIGGRPLHLLIMGDGPLRASLKQQAGARGGRVHFTGWVDHALAALPIADVFVCPSREEPLGNVILEAWSQRMPVVSTTSDGGRELIEDGRTGLLAPIAEPRALAAALEQALRDEPLRRSLSAIGHAVYSSRYSEQGTIEAYIGFYQRMLKLHKPG